MDAKTEISPAQAELGKLIQELLALNTKLVLKVAANDCEKAKDCPVVKIARQIAKILDKFQELGPTQQ